ncbi:unnamed protein product [Phytophthora fragariaefolia]|uniref:Unnamed protein product n=1 Tax=Phytophthora fragariaefolia TaxID=1490495 RepID=A0A9W6XVC4_9STRA|nr:unnamed protein product [Phytophthora fragariaefolia]
MLRSTNSRLSTPQTTHLVIDPGSPKINDTDRDSQGATPPWPHFPRTCVQGNLRSGFTFPKRFARRPFLGYRYTPGRKRFHRPRHKRALIRAATAVSDPAMIVALTTTGREIASATTLVLPAGWEKLKLYWLKVSNQRSSIGEGCFFVKNHLHAMLSV